ncbi:TlpA disulfide reductase family protein [uncultured Polaribacter sp.]|uniref:TlpA disulfide reductase family protein n=1 Tax=uncultured Polaribacter sp. TaxID=174711 RepID=UPI00261F2B50|nr:TlpA disulfide reductase family protein [uncultured Polaribacter sp.]
MNEAFKSCLLISIGLLGLFNISCKDDVSPEGYTIKGKVRGIHKGWVHIIQPSVVDRNSKGKVIDSAEILNGAFLMKGKVDNIDRVSMTIGENYFSSSGFFIENSPINLDIDLEKANEYGRFDYEISGSKTHDLYLEQVKYERAIMTQEKYRPLIALREDMVKAYKSNDEVLIEKFSKKAKALEKLSEERQEDYQTTIIDFIKKHPSSPVSPYILGFQFNEGRMTKERMKKTYRRFEGEAKKTAMYQYFKKVYTEIFETLREGAVSPDFTLTSLNGEEITLSQVKGKYLLIDFWASWCKPCRSSFPHLKELYGKYKNKGFEIIAIGTNDEKAKWENAIEEDNTPWIHLFDEPKIKKLNEYGEVAKLYGVPFLPTTFLLDKNRIILGRQLRDNDLDNKLKEIFGY